MVSDVMGKASQMILHAGVDGEADPVRLADFAAGRVRASREILERALTGKVTAHHRFLLGEHLRQIEHRDEAIERISKEIARRLTPPEPPSPHEEEEKPAVSPKEAKPGSSSSSAAWSDSQNWQHAVEVIDQITGISQRIAEGLLAEIGVKMDQFPSAKHLASWVGVCPGNHESAGKRLVFQNPQRQSVCPSTAHSSCSRCFSQEKHLVFPPSLVGLLPDEGH